MFTRKDETDKHFMCYFFEQGWKDGNRGNLYSPPPYNKRDRLMYHQGFEESREILSTRKPCNR
jgi:hypothetical protein